MNLLIAGSRDISLADACYAMDRAYWMLRGTAPDRLITGDAFGVDQHGQKWWLELFGDEDTIDHFPADWEQFGKRAGYIRNAEMVEVADQAIIVWDGVSRGTAHTISLLEMADIETVIINLRTHKATHTGMEHG